MMHSINGVVTRLEHIEQHPPRQRHRRHPPDGDEDEDEELIKTNMTVSGMGGGCNIRFTKGHKTSNHIRARIKSHVYTIE